MVTTKGERNEKRKGRIDERVNRLMRGVSKGDGRMKGGRRTMIGGERSVRDVIAMRKGKTEGRDESRTWIWRDFGV